MQKPEDKTLVKGAIQDVPLQDVDQNSIIPEFSSQDLKQNIEFIQTKEKLADIQKVREELGADYCRF